MLLHIICCIMITIILTNLIAPYCNELYLQIYDSDQNWHLAWNNNWLTQNINKLLIGLSITLLRIIELLSDIYVYFLTLWNRKGTQWATWELIWSLWVSTGLKWTHFEWPYFAVAKLGLNWSQSVSFWVATNKLHPQQTPMVSFCVTPACKG